MNWSASLAEGALAYSDWDMRPWLQVCRRLPYWQWTPCPKAQKTCAAVLACSKSKTLRAAVDNSALRLANHLSKPRRVLATWFFENYSESFHVLRRVWSQQPKEWYLRCIFELHSQTNCCPTGQTLSTIRHRIIRGRLKVCSRWPRRFLWSTICLIKFRGETLVREMLTCN